MTKNNNDIRDKIIKGLELTYKKLIKFKKERNLDIVVSENGKVIKLHPRDLK